MQFNAHGATRVQCTVLVRNPIRIDWFPGHLQNAVDASNFPPPHERPFPRPSCRSISERPPLVPVVANHGRCPRDALGTVAMAKSTFPGPAPLDSSSGIPIRPANVKQRARSDAVEGRFLRVFDRQNDRGRPHCKSMLQLILDESSMPKGRGNGARFDSATRPKKKDSFGQTGLGRTVDRGEDRKGNRTSVCRANGGATLSLRYGVRHPLLRFRS